jgi:eukaryotic-like serine/threonine-protein kinase
MTPKFDDLAMQVESPEWHDLFEQEASQAQQHRIDPTNQIVGPYKVLRSLGQGGMGEVFLAERADQQFQQRVAIKLVRRGLLSRQVQSRLRIERQILASLEHPNIARLLDGGSTQDGIPYIVMEYVDGQPIDTYCDEHRLTIRQRLELFRSVCAAVHSAHQNLIVHRDLKPSNILVTAAGVPKLLDFGIAKMLDTRQLTQTVALTEADFRMLTPDHASPEQLSGDLITTASDTYVLGVLLYELLTGCKPFAIKGQSFGELERIICEEPPLPPHQVFTLGSPSSKQSLEEIAAARCSTAIRLGRELRGDLSSIILMALRKEPERRYSSVRQFSDDIERYLQGMPVHARQDAWTYRAAKFVRRHAVVVAMGSVLIATLLGAAGIAWTQKIRVDQERAVAQAVSDFLINTFTTADPDRARGKQLTALEILDSGAKRIRSELAGQKDQLALLLNTIGEVYMRLGAYERAEPLLEDSWRIFRNELKTETPVLATVALNLGELNKTKGDLKKAEEFTRLSIGIGAKVEGPLGLAVSRGECGLGIIYLQAERLAAAEDQFRKCIGMYEALSNVPVEESSIPINYLARLLSRRGDYEGAETLHRRWLDTNRNLASDSPIVIDTQQNLATVLQARGKLQEAASLYRTVIAATRKVWPTSERLVIALTNQGSALQELTQFDVADLSFQEALMLHNKLKLSDADRAYLLGRMASLDLDRGDTAKAERVYREAMTLIGTQGAQPRYRSALLLGLSKTLLQRNQPREAQTYIEQALPLLEQLQLKNDYRYSLARAVLGRALWLQESKPQGTALLREGYDKYIAQRGPNVPEARLLRSWLDATSSPVGAR